MPQHQDSLASFAETPTLDGYDWQFSGADTTYHIHGLLGYPARMPPQMPSQIIRYLKATDQLSAGDTIVDPFCGSGTTAPEARSHHLDFHGVDINPFACHLARAKATPFPPADLANAYETATDNWHIHERFIDDAATTTTAAGEALQTTDKDGEIDRVGDPVALKNHWFPKPQVHKLDNLSRRLAEARGYHSLPAIRLLRLALGKTARDVSYQQPNEFKRQRISPEERQSHDPDVFNIFSSTVADFYDRLVDFHAQTPTAPETTVMLGDSRDPTLLASNSADAIVTSPPYGDSQTTVGYGQYSNIPANAATPLSYSRMRAVDSEALGGRDTEPFIDLEQSTLRDHADSLDVTLTRLAEVDGRHDDALGFVTDYTEALIQMARVCKPGQPTILVVGNRTMSRVPIPLHHITAELALAIGFEHEGTVERSIPTKTLPYANAPENIPGETLEMMADEYLVELSAPAEPASL
jgi:site-specific DNA-methyltransferase (cytosine-N4-specific)